MKIAILIGSKISLISAREIAIARHCIELVDKTATAQSYPDPEQWRGRGKRKMRVTK